MSTKGSTNQTNSCWTPRKFKSTYIQKNAPEEIKIDEDLGNDGLNNYIEDDSDDSSSLYDDDSIDEELKDEEKDFLRFTLNETIAQDQ